MSKLFNKVLSASARSVVATLLLSSTTLASYAGNMYIYKDESGQILLTNVHPSGNFGKYSKKVKVTYYQDNEAEFQKNKTLLPNLTTPTYHVESQQTITTSANTAAGNIVVASIGTANNTYDHFIIDSANRHGVDPALLKAMMHTESAFNPNARSPVGAQGLMQLMPATARRFSVHNAWNPADNIEGAAKYVAWLSKRFNGNIEYVLAGYNAGEGNVDKYGGIPPFRETRNYVKKVLNRYDNLYKNDTNLLNTADYNTVANNELANDNTELKNTFATSGNTLSTPIYTLR